MFRRSIGPIFAISTIIFYAASTLPSSAVTINFGPITETPDGAVETDPSGKPKVTTAGQDISVITEAGAVNESTRTGLFSAFLTVLGGVITQDTANALNGVGSLIDAVNSGTDSATSTVRYQLAVSYHKPIIHDVTFRMTGVFITEEVKGLVFTDTTKAEVENASIKFGNKSATVAISPSSDTGDSETPEARTFTGTAHIVLDEPVSAATFVFESTFNASESGGPRDSVSAAILTGWDATISIVPLPASALMLLTALWVAVMLRREHR